MSALKGCNRKLRSLCLSLALRALVTVECFSLLWRNTLISLAAWKRITTCLMQ
jgi:hypothetical protein